jgi:subtilisin family serine protease
MKLTKSMLVGLGVLAMTGCGPEDEQQVLTGEQEVESVSRFLTVSEPVQGQFIVKLREDSKVPAVALQRDVAEVAQELAAARGGQVFQVYRHSMRGFAVRMSEEQARQLARHPLVEHVEQDGMSYPSTTQSGATWGIDRTDQRALPLSGTYVYFNTGAGVNAYIIDTGILASHSELSGRVFAGYTGISDGRGTSDCNGHGTHVAGTVGGRTYGIAKSVNLYPVRVFGCTGGSAYSTIIAGVDWVVANHRKPAVINMSLGGGADASMDAAVNRAISAGITVVVAAGNSNANACNYSPARVSGAITVGASTRTDSRDTGYSNFGSCLDMFAPGTGITSAWYTSTTATSTISGTSMASPHVAGTAALYLQSNPGAAPATVASALVNAATTNVVTNAGTGSPNRLLYNPY